MSIKGVLGYVKTEYGYSPITESDGRFLTRAFIFCCKCKSSISSHGGPSEDALCIPCYQNAAKQDFAQININGVL
jgi:hypothetical protein